MKCSRRKVLTVPLSTVYAACLRFSSTASWPLAARAGASTKAFRAKLCSSASRSDSYLNTRASLKVSGTGPFTRVSDFVRRSKEIAHGIYRIQIFQSMIRSKWAGRQSLISLAVIHSLLNLHKTNYLSSGDCDNDRCQDKNPGKTALFDQLISDTVSRC